MRSETDMIKITFTGDIMCEHTRLEQLLYNGKYDFSPVFDDVKPIFQNSDFVVANLETPLAGEELKYSEKKFSFNTPDEMADAIKNCGIDLVTTANNHVLDRGIDGLERTIDILDRNGIFHTGSYKKNEEPKPFIKDIGGIKVAFIAYTYGTEACFNNHYLRKSEQRMVNLTRRQELSNPIKRFFLVNKAILAKGFRFLYRCVCPNKARIDVSERKERDLMQKKRIEEDVEQCKKLCVDYIVMCLHCGGQFNDEPTAYTKHIVEYCLDQGIDAVITNHEHRIQVTKSLENGIVAYCLGNLTSNYGIQREPLDKYAEYSALLNLYLSKENNVTYKYSVSFVKSHLDKNGVIITSPVHKLYQQCKSDDEKEKLREGNLWCLNTFYDLTLNDAPVISEYFADEWA